MLVESNECSPFGNLVIKVVLPGESQLSPSRVQSTDQLQTAFTGPAVRVPCLGQRTIQSHDSPALRTARADRMTMRTMYAAVRGIILPSLHKTFYLVFRDIRRLSGHVLGRFTEDSRQA